MRNIAITTAIALVAATTLMGNANQALAQQSPNERVHVLQKRDYSVKGKFEISTAFGVSVNEIFTRQLAASLSLDYHVNEAFALELNWLTSKVPFANGQEAGDGKYTGDNLRWGNTYTSAVDEGKSVHLRPQDTDLIMMSNFVGLNVQFSPLYGKWNLFGWLGHADFYLSAGGGVATTEYRNADEQWVDTGAHFVGSFGLGFRIFINRWFAVRADLRDYAFAVRLNDGTSEMSKIRNTIFVNLGLSFLFGGEEQVQIWSPY